MAYWIGRRVQSFLVFWNTIGCVNVFGSANAGKYTWEEKTMDIEDVAREIIDSAIKVHRILGPGLLESTYQKCLKTN